MIEEICCGSPWWSKPASWHFSEVNFVVWIQSVPGSHDFAKDFAFLEQTRCEGAEAVFSLIREKFFYCPYCSRFPRLLACLNCFQMWLTAIVPVSATLLTSHAPDFNIVVRRRVKQSSLCISPEQNTRTMSRNTRSPETRLAPDLLDSLPIFLFLFLYYMYLS